MQKWKEDSEWSGTTKEMDNQIKLGKIITAADCKTDRVKCNAQRIRQLNAA